MTEPAGAVVATSRVQATIPVGPRLHGDLAVPRDAVGVVVFAHGSGSSRFSPRNRLVAEALNRRGLATLLFDLLTPDEEPQQSTVFDVELLRSRLSETTRWVTEHPLVTGLPLSYFGASTGAAAALAAAASFGDAIHAVVSRGGRPDLVPARLGEVVAPTLLVAGERDDVVLGLNRDALGLLSCTRQLAVVRGAGHLFEETGALERVAELSGEWLLRRREISGGQGADLGEIVVDPA